MKFQAMQANPSRGKAYERLPGAGVTEGRGDSLETTAVFTILTVSTALQGCTHMRTYRVCTLSVRHLLYVKYTSVELSLTVRNVWRYLDFLHNWAQVLFLGRSHGPYRRSVQV